ncbi:hypothetical protein [Cytobacillus praedii]|uniref:hypothetical protein n=1 Tax=Cytobacillus praedii TaxID=1742358 RepID=UPI003F821476
MLIGGLLAIYLIGKETGVYDYELLFPITLGTVGGFLIFLAISKLKQKRNGNVPDFDERSVLLIKKYLMISLYVILFGSGAAVIIVYAMGIKYIETGILMIYLFSLYIILGLGTLVVKRL